MKLEGSCCCKKVKFTVNSLAPYPYMHCYCSYCRKTGGGGGFAINIRADATSLVITGSEFVKIFQAQVASNRIRKSTKPSGNLRHFCGDCGSHLYSWQPSWPNWIYPLASAIDTKLPKPLERVHINTKSATSWCNILESKQDTIIANFPDESIEDYHKRHNIYSVT